MNTSSKYLWMAIVLVIAAVLVGSYVWHPWTTPGASVSPSASVTPFADDKIQLDSPLPGALVTSPLVVRGKARGTWFFEASFPVTLKDANGKVLAQAPAQAQGDWMTTDWVPFEVTLTFAKPTTATGTLVLQKDNPSGLPEHDDSRQITVLFK